MKKVLMIALAIIMVFGIAACSAQTEEPVQETEKAEDAVTEEPVAEETVTEEPAAEEPATGEVVSEEPIKIATLAGPTGMGLVNLINDETGRYEVELLTQPDQIIPKIISGEVDVATIPSNLASVLYNKTQGAISVISVNTKGVLYILENDDEVASIADLKGKTIKATGQGASPEYVLNRILKENGLTVGEDVIVEYLPAHGDLSTALGAGDETLGLLPEPHVSIASAKNPELQVKIDLNEEWQAIFGENVEIPMGVTIAQNEFLEANPELVESLMADYSVSVDYVNNDIDAAAEDIVTAGIVGSAGIAKNAIPRCGISFVTGEEAQTMLEQYFSVLFESNPKSVGGALPDEAFYYQK